MTVLLLPALNVRTKFTGVGLFTRNPLRARAIRKETQT
jgi:hypothetical protein